MEGVQHRTAQRAGLKIWLSQEVIFSSTDENGHKVEGPRKGPFVNLE